MKPLVSVIITTKNEEKHIDNCLRSIKDQTLPQEKIEIIVVDNNSTDKTKEIARRYSEKVYNFGPERAAQRNFGVRQADAKYILYLDADMILSKGVINECLERCEQEGEIALYIPERIMGKGFWIKIRDFERAFYNATVVDCVRFIRKDKFLEIGAFDENLTGPEDWDFDRRIKGQGKIGIIYPPIYHDEGRLNLGEYIGKKAYYFPDVEKYKDKWGRLDQIIIKQTGFRYRALGVFIENGKWKRLLSHPILACGMYFLRALVGIRYLAVRNQMKANNQGILIICPFFRPNIGGVETHLDDLCEYLERSNYSVFVITYQPLTTKSYGLRLERKGNMEIRRVRWPGFDLFHKLEPYPLLEILYLTPRLFIATFLFLLSNHRKIRTIHAHGLNAALIARLNNFIFKKRVVLSIHSIYNYNKGSLFARGIRWVTRGIDVVMPLAERSKDNFVSIGIPKNRLKIYTQWVNQDLFKPMDKDACREKLGLRGDFIALFVGRLIEKKGAGVFIDAAKKLPAAQFVLVGDGPMLYALRNASSNLRNIHIAGRKDQAEISFFYGASSVVVIPSQYEEGFARVVLESLFSGRPVIAANKGCLSEMITEEVGILLEPTADNIARAIQSLRQDRQYLMKITENSRPYALKHFSQANAQEIINSYQCQNL